MATSSSGRGKNWQGKITCRYFVHGLCKAGNTCNYSHDRSSVVDNVCKYYKEGTCYYGDKCKFSHGEPGSKSQTRGNVKKIPSKCKVLPLQVQSPPKEPGRKLTPLKPGGKPKAVPFTGKDFNFEDVLDVPEFIPGQKYQGSAKIPSSYSSAVSKDRSKTDSQSSPGGERGISQRDILCPFAIKGTCRYGENCAYTHGAVCEFCNFACLYPFETEENKKHIAECISNHEVSMNESFALQQSKSIACSICMEVVLEKTNRKDQKFGILNNCTHPFCLECIRKWRSSKECEKKVVKGCPVCRVSSDFVCPSDYWVVDEEEKVTMIKKYKEALSQKACKYFSEGNGECPFGANCFYKHAYPDGTLQDRSKIRKYGNGSGKMKTHHAINLWDFLEERDLSGDDEDDFFLFGSGWEDLDSGDLEDYLLYRALFAGSDSDDDSVEDLMLGINMLGLTLVGAAAASLGRGRREGGGSGSTSNQSSNQSSSQCVNNGDEGNRGSDDSWLTG